MHTPTPWTSMFDTEFILGISASVHCAETGKLVAMCGCDDSTPEQNGYIDAKYIVRCVNAHDQLVKQMKNAIRVMRLAVGERDTLLSDETRAYLYGATSRCEAALAAAEGE